MFGEYSNNMVTAIVLVVCLILFLVIYSILSNKIYKESLFEFERTSCGRYIMKLEYLFYSRDKVFDSICLDFNSLPTYKNFDVSRYMKKWYGKADDHGQNFDDFYESIVCNREIIKDLFDTMSKFNIREYYSNKFFVKRLQKKRYFNLLKKVVYEHNKSCYFTIETRYTSPQGRNSYRRVFHIGFNELYVFHKQYLGYSSEKATKKRERNKLNKSLRYKVLKNDDFTCRYCGRSSVKDGVKLHIDHIKPIAKGGLTVFENLQTLCEDCNLGKSDDWN